MAERGITAGAVCVYHAMVADRGRGARAAPASRSPPSRPAFPPACRRWRPAAGRDRGVGRAPAPPRSTSSSPARHVLTGNWQALYDEIAAMRAACGDAHMKAILGTGDLGTLRNVAPRLAGGDDGGRRFHQDLDRQGERSTPRCRSAWRWCARSATTTSAPAIRVGFKPAGGISTAKDALDYLALMKEELGDRWLRAGPVPLRRLVAARRHRAPARAPSSPAATRPVTATRWREAVRLP